MDKQTFHINRIIEMVKEKPKKRWCKNHPLSKWEVGYRHCAQGHRMREECKEGE